MVNSALLGIPTAPTAAQGTNTTQLATTAFVVAQAFAGVLPAQPGNAGKTLVTNGTAATWSALAWASVSGTPTTLAGYGITDAATSSAPTISNANLTGAPVAPTLAVNVSTTGIATTAWMMGQASALAPNMDGVATVGVGTAWARSDHIHPIDSSRQPALGYTPPRVPGSSSGSTNTISFGWNGTLSKLVMAVDATQFSNVWPIDISGNCSGTAAAATLAANSSAVNGMSGWTYTNTNTNPTYLWCNDGAGTYQHLTTPASLSVNYANSSGSCSGNAATCTTASNSAALGGSAPGYYLNNGGTAIQYLTNSGSTYLNAYIGGFGGVNWPVTASDERLKENIVDSTEDSLAKISRISFKSFTYRVLHPGTPEEFHVDDGRVHVNGVIAQNLESIEPNWLVDVADPTSWKTPNTQSLLYSALHAIKQLQARVVALEARA